MPSGLLGASLSLDLLQSSETGTPFQILACLDRGIFKNRRVGQKSMAGLFVHIVCSVLWDVAWYFTDGCGPKSFSSSVLLKKMQSSDMGF